MKKVKEKKQKIMCDCCKRAEATQIDYRFIDCLGLQGKVLVCKYCVCLDDVEFYREYIKEV